MPTAAGMYYSVHEGGQFHLPAVVLIHGAGGTCLSWPTQVRRMPGQHVIALDLPGHGKSGGYAQQSIMAYADQVRALLSEIGLEEVVLVGHSMGGAVALTLALKYPRLVAGLGLVSTGANLEVDPALLESLSNPVTVAEGLAHIQSAAFSPHTNPALVEACMQPLRALRPSLLLADYTACAQFDLREMVHQVGAPTWVMTGAQDRMTPPAYANYLAARLPNATASVIAEAGHMLPAEQPELLAHSLRSFLTERLAAIQEYRFTLHREHATVHSAPSKGRSR